MSSGKKLLSLYPYEKVLLISVKAVLKEIIVNSVNSSNNNALFKLSYRI